ncbi:MAG: Bug family tripartite tricarboxylate transporter substrate binding protein [Xanthobacteraceae bacterium]
MTRFQLPRRGFLGLAAGAAAVTAVGGVARGQSYPSRPVRFVVGFPAGGGADAATRILAARLSELWGEQVVVENRGGAGGNLAHEMVAHASPDGYTMLMGTNSLPVNPFLFPGLTFDPLSDFAPVSLIGTYPNLMVVPTDARSKTLPEFMVRAKVETVTFATPGVGSSPHLAAELFKHMAQINMTHVPYRGVAAGAMNDLLAGRLDAMFNTTGSLLQAVRAGQVRALAISSAAREQNAPEIPTFAESGVPGYAVESWYAVFVPTKTPIEITRTINADVVKALGDPAVKARFEPLGVAVASSTPDQLAARMRAEAELWGPIVKAANIKGD